jgi:hypothetical protein
MKCMDENPCKHAIYVVTADGKIDVNTVTSKEVFEIYKTHHQVVPQEFKNKHCSCKGH